MVKKITFHSFILFITLLFFFNSSFSKGSDPLKPIPKLNRKVLVTIHLVVPKNNVLMFDTSAVFRMMESVNKTFKPIGILFDICELRLIENYNYEVVDISKGDAQNALLTYSVQNSVNVFFTKEIRGATGKLCGYTEGTITSRTISGIFLSCYDVGNFLHELGHYFGLDDTSKGSGSELVNGSNCTEAGDRICDTPADPFKEGSNIAEYINSACTFVYTGKDGNNLYYTPDVSNPMSLYSPCRCQQFSKGQYLRMSENYLKNSLSW